MHIPNLQGMYQFILFYFLYQHSSVQFSCSVVSDSLRLHGLPHTRPPCPSPTPGVYSHPCPSSWSCHPAISSSVVPFSSCPQSLSASESFPMSQLFAWGAKYWSFSFSISPASEHRGLISFRMDWLDLLAVQKLASVNSSSVFKVHQTSKCQKTTFCNKNGTKLICCTMAPVFVWGRKMRLHRCCPKKQGRSFG